MADELSITIDTKALDDALSKLPTKLQTRILKQALQAGGDVILEEMRTLAPERTDEDTPDSTSLPPGILKADLQTQVTVSTTTGANVKIGPGEIAGRVAKWQNNGYNLTTHGKKRGRKVIKAVPGKHFIEGAMDTAGQKALDAMIGTIVQALTEDNGDE
jgi:hypothetical protein